MSQVPPPYNPSTNFATIAEQPIIIAGLPGTQLDQEFQNIKSSVDQTISRLSEIQRDDGALRNGVVTSASLSQEVMTLLTTGGATVRGLWWPETSYQVGDIVQVGEFSSAVISNAPGDPTSPDVTGALGFAGYGPGGYPVFNNWMSSAPFDSESGGSPRLLVRIEGTWQIMDSPAGWPYPVGGGWFATTGTTSYDPKDAGGWTAGNEYSSGTPVITTYVNSNPGTYICIEDHFSGESFYPVGKWAILASTEPVGDLVVSSFEGDGSETDFTLQDFPVNESNTQVYIDGLYVSKSAYSLSGNVITFSVAPENGKKIEVVSGITVEVPVYSPGTDSVGTSSLQNGAVTEAKIAAGAVTAGKMAELSVTTQALQAESVTNAKLAVNAVAASNLQAVSVTEGKIADGAISRSKVSNGAIDNTKISAGGVFTSNLADGSVTSAKIGSREVKGSNIGLEEVKGENLSSTAVAESLEYTPANRAGDNFTGAVSSDVSMLAPNTPKAYASFNVRTSAGAATLNSSFNIASVTYSDTGTYQVVFSSNMPDDKYAVVASAVRSGSQLGFTVDISDKTSSGFTLVTVRNNLAVNNNLAGASFIVLR